MHPIEEIHGDDDDLEYNFNSPPQSQQGTHTSEKTIALINGNSNNSSNNNHQHQQQQSTSGNITNPYKPLTLSSDTTGSSSTKNPVPNNALFDRFKHGLSRRFADSDTTVPEHIKNYDATWSEGANAVDDVSCVLFPIAFAVVLVVMIHENPGIFAV